MLHFRHFLISALMVCAALILPGQAFAEKNEPNGNANSHKELVPVKSSLEKTAAQTNLPAKAEQAKSVAKPVVVPEPASKRQNEVKQQISKGVPKQVVSQKPAVAPKSLPEQANGKGYGLSNSKKTEQPVNAPGQEKSAAVQESKKEFVQELKTTPAKNFSKIPTVENKTESTKLVNRVEPQAQGSDVSVPKKVEYSKPIVTRPAEKEKVPSSKEEIPAVDQAVNPTTRSNSSGGPSNDRVSQGPNMITPLDKWFEWIRYYEIKLIQPYLSRYAFLNNQWVNAPPSPPPQVAPLL